MLYEYFWATSWMARAHSLLPPALAARDVAAAYLRRFHLLNFQSASEQAFRHLHEADTSAPPGEPILSSSIYKGCAWRFLRRRRQSLRSHAAVVSFLDRPRLTFCSEVL